MDDVKKILELLTKDDNAIIKLLRSKPYGIVHKTAPIRYLGWDGLLVWDYIIWNELTFEVAATGKKYSLANRFSDEEIEKIFNDLVEKYGI